MPLRSFCREQVWLLPPRVDEWVPGDHPVRFIASLVDALARAAWLDLGINPDGDAYGAPAYHPRVLLSVWLYGFMTGTRSARKLEAACRDNIAYLWLTGCQYPDHNTLWRFYQAHRKQMRKLLKRTVRAAIRLGLIDLAVQALDGTKIAANAARERTYDAKGLTKLLERTETAIADLEAQNHTPTDAAPPRLPAALQQAQELREHVRVALTQVQAEEGPARSNLTDPDAVQVKGRQGVVPGYNAQAVVSGLNPQTAGRRGLFITAADVVAEPDDHAQLLPMLALAAETSGETAGVSLADGGYHSGPNLAACAAQGSAVRMPESQAQELKSPYHKDRFVYDAETDTYTCPKGQTLRHSGTTQRADRPAAEIYRSTGDVCRACPAFGTCTKDKRQGRSLEIGPHEEILRQHRATMATAEAKEQYKLRKELVEPSFGILKEVQSARRFLLRGLNNVRAEWALLATTFNLRSLHRVWQRRGADERRALAAAVST